MEFENKIKIGILIDTNLLISMLFEDFRRKIYKDFEISKNEKEKFIKLLKEKQKIKGENYFEIAKKVLSLREYLEDIEKNSNICFSYYVTPGVLEETLRNFKYIIKRYSKEIEKNLYRKLEKYINNLEGKIIDSSYRSNGNGYSFSLLGFKFHSYKKLENKLISYLEGKVDKSDLEHISDANYIRQKKGLYLVIFVTKDEKMIKNYKGAKGLKKSGILVLSPQDVIEFFEIYLKDVALEETVTLIGSKKLPKQNYQTLIFKN